MSLADYDEKLEINSKPADLKEEFKRI